MDADFKCFNCNCKSRGILSEKTGNIFCEHCLTLIDIQPVAWGSQEERRWSHKPEIEGSNPSPATISSGGI